MMHAGSMGRQTVYTLLLCCFVMPLVMCNPSVCIHCDRARSTGKDESATPLTTMGGQLRGLLNFKLKFSPADGYSLSGATTPDAASASRHEQAGGPLSSNQDLSRALAGLGTSSSRALHRYVAVSHDGMMAVMDTNPVHEPQGVSLYAGLMQCAWRVHDTGQAAVMD